MNLLSGEKSPYLLMHADNPVDWRPWGDEAFNEAKRLDRPVFVSSGYSACHWCHVMAEESFEDLEVAQLLNDGFVCVKLDREERPDVDSFLMQACQLMTGSGGWPLSAFLAPDGRPFFAGTYYPRHSRGGLIGFCELLEAIRHSWEFERGNLISTSDRLMSAVRELQAASPGEMDGELINRCYQELSRSFDAQYGGFGRAPKFPTPHLIMFLMRFHFFEGSARALELASRTLDAMCAGGMYDHIGGGFCRYSTDRRWLVPHFEKMLYDNALLALTYTEAFQLTRERRYANVAGSTLDYVLREMRGAEGGFFSAQDADSDGVEGAYYLLTKSEVLGELGTSDGEAVCAALGITDGGNFEGRSIPNRINAAGGAELPEELMPALSKLYDYRKRRIELRVDDKCLTAWNALMIAALAEASGALERPEYLDAALGALSFIDEYLTRPDGELFIRWRDGEAAGDGTLDDYAFLCWALVSIYDATLDASYMMRARSLMERLTARFGGEPGHGFWLNAEGSGLAVRPKESADSALPSGNSVAAMMLVRLSRFFADDDFLREQADAQLRYVAGAANQAPSGHAHGLSAGLLSAHPARELVLATDSGQDAMALRQMLRERFMPDVTALLVDPENAGQVPPWAVNCTMRGNETTYYLCQNNACGLPIRDLQSVIGALE